ncbi:MAG: DUF4132 domain-containing protein [Planctomycetes bacterium]|nr:DUF4132 domain-containing protein [Planctomycetota bacterium]
MKKQTDKIIFHTLVSDFIGNIKSFGAYSASNLSFWHPLVTLSEYKQQNILHQHPEYKSFFKFYLMLKYRFGNSLSEVSCSYYENLLGQIKFSNSINERNLLFLIELFVIIEKKQNFTQKICQMLEDRIKKSTIDETFPLPVFSAVYLLLTDIFAEIPSGFLTFIKESLFELPVFENSKNRLLFSNLLSYAYEREILDDKEFQNMLQNMNYVPLSGTYNNFMQVVRLKYDVEYGSRSDGFFRMYNCKLLDSFSNCSEADYAINGKFKIHNQWCGRKVVLKTLAILSRQPNLSTNIFNDTPESTLWFILRNLWHIENDTLEEDLTSEDLQEFSESTLLTFAFLSPSFAGVIEKTIGIAGLEQLALWNIIHTSLEYIESPTYPYIKRSQSAISRKISQQYCYSLVQHRYEKLEIGWFRDIQEIIDDSKLKKLLKYLPLPFPEKRMKTWEIAEMLITGKMKTKENAPNIIAKYPFFTNKDELHKNLISVLGYLSEVLVSSKSKKQKILPKIWAFLENTANYFDKIDINYLLLPEHLDVFLKPKPKTIKIPTGKKPTKKKTSKTKKEFVCIDSASTKFHRLKILVSKNGKVVKRVERSIKQLQEYKDVEFKINFINEFLDKFYMEYESRIVKNRYSTAAFWEKTKNTGIESILVTMIFSVNDNFGFVEYTDDGLKMNTVDDEQIIIEPADVLYLTNPKQIHESGNFIKCAEAVVKRRLYQPTSQVFSEVCSQEDCEEILNQWSKVQFSQTEFNAVLSKRGWNVNCISNICKYDNINALIIKIYTKNDSQYPFNTTINSIEDVQFFNRKTNKTVSYYDVDESIINGIFDDLHLALSSSAITPLQYSFAPMLQTFIRLYLESVGFKKVVIDEKKLAFVLPNAKKSIELIFDEISPLENSESCDISEIMSDTITDENEWNYYPHSVSLFWRIALCKLKAKIIEVYPDFNA